MEHKRSNPDFAGRQKDAARGASSSSDRKESEEDQNADINKRGRLEIFNSVIATLTLVAVMYYAWIAHGTLAAMQTASALTNRPYIGYDGVSVTYVSTDRTGRTINTQVPTPTTANFGISAGVKNFGPVPGTKFIAHWRVFINGVEQPTQVVSSTSQTLFPGQIVHLRGQVGKDYKPIMSQEETLIVQIYAQYDGPTGHYEECEKAQFAPAISGFLDLGDCTF